MKVFCIDVGNTHTHFGVIADDDPSPPREVETPHLDDPAGPLEAALSQFVAAEGESAAVAFCSVVPSGTERLETMIDRLGRPLSPFQLTCKSKLGMPISYPRPEEIGQDRLANAVAATAHFPLPCIVIDMGTAVTFDIVTASGGYEGGIIAPGLRIMTQYLHEQTALLPDLDEDLEVQGAIGRSTRQAMKIGCLIGFGGMIQSLLEAVIRELAKRKELEPCVVATGGAAGFLEQALRQKLLFAPAITLQGLARAYRLNRPKP